MNKLMKKLTKQAKKYGMDDCAPIKCISNKTFSYVLYGDGSGELVVHKCPTGYALYEYVLDYDRHNDKIKNLDREIKNREKDLKRLRRAKQALLKIKDEYKHL